MKNDKSKNIIIVLLIIIIIILITLVVLFATNTISFNSGVNDNSNELSSDNVNEDNNTSMDNIVENEENVNWVSYLLSLHLLDAKITRVRSKDLGDTEDLNKTVTINMDELKELLSKIENNKLLKTYSQGRGGPDRDHLVVSYEYNDEKYEFEIFYGSISVDKLDDNFKSLLNNNNYEEKNIEYKDTEGSFYFYAIDGYSESIFDEYFV